MKARILTNWLDGASARVAIRTTAIEAHTGQRYGDFPYEKHLDDVATLALKFGLPEDVVRAAYLHDAVEDTPVSTGEIYSKFGKEIALLVFSVTDEPGKNRKERHKKTYRKLIMMGADAVALKLCDRIANMRHSREHGTLLDMYINEYKEFRTALYTVGQNEELWEELDNEYRHCKRVCAPCAD